MDAHRQAKQILRLLVDQLAGKGVVESAVGQLVILDQLAALAYHHPFAAVDVIIVAIVLLPLQHHVALAAPQPIVDVLLEDILLCQRRFARLL